jgi:ferritin-like metal-binding protein YciE
MGMDSLERLFVEELRDMYSAEKQLTTALKKMSKAAQNEELREAFDSHRQETEQQVERLERVFATMDMKPRAKKCKGIAGIVEESSEMMAEDGEPDVLDAALIAGAQRAEHYEISAYGTLRHWADQLGNQEAARLLSETLEEEKAADKKLNAIAKRVVNPRARETA